MKAFLWAGSRLWGQWEPRPPCLGCPGPSDSSHPRAPHVRTFLSRGGHQGLYQTPSAPTWSVLHPAPPQHRPPYRIPPLSSAWILRALHISPALLEGLLAAMFWASFGGQVLGSLKSIPFPVILINVFQAAPAWAKPATFLSPADFIQLTLTGGMGRKGSHGSWALCNFLKGSLASQGSPV